MSFIVIASPGILQGVAAHRIAGFGHTGIDPRQVGHCVNIGKPEASRQWPDVTYSLFSHAVRPGVFHW
jgi:hypothetical protein